MADSMRAMAGYSRMIRFDKRGTGMSDPVSGAPTLDDADGRRPRRSWMPSVHGERRSYGVLGGRGAPRSCSPPRTRNAPPRWSFAVPLRPDAVGAGLPVGEHRGRLPAASRAGAADLRAAREGDRLGTTPLGDFDEREAEEFVDYLRYGASPGMLEALLRHEQGHRHSSCPARRSRPDARPARRGRRRRVDRPAARYLAQRIPGAQLQVD